MNYTDARIYLEAASKLGSRPGLANILSLCELLDNPQDKLCFVHVAGTNGKGSVCSMIAEILKAADYKTGLFLSPHIDEYTSSFYINGEMISEDEFSSAVLAVSEQAEKLKKHGKEVTEFELLTACAFYLFDKCGCDVVVLETGMGGSLDATNIINNTLVSVITEISMDHVSFLGDTIEKITRHKCGIIKKDGITVSYPCQQQAALNIIISEAEKKDNFFIMPDIRHLEICDLSIKGTDLIYKGLRMHIKFSGKHQALNCITAVEAVYSLRKYRNFLVSDEAVINGIRNAFLPARHEIISEKPLILIDGAHNLQGIAALAQTIRSLINQKPIAVIMGMLSDKDYKECIKIMAELSDKFLAVTPKSPRALTASAAVELAKEYCMNASHYSDIDEALNDAVAFCGDAGAVIVCGSFYLANPMRNLILNQKYLQADSLHGILCVRYTE